MATLIKVVLLGTHVIASEIGFNINKLFIAVFIKESPPDNTHYIIMLVYCYINVLYHPWFIYVFEGLNK